MTDQIPQSIQVAREHLSRLREREKGRTIEKIKEIIDRQELVDDLEAFEKEREGSRKQTIERSEAVSTRVVQELLQNAHDVQGCHAVVFTLTPNKLVVENDGRVMTQENVDRLCSFNRTTKSETDLIGKFGTGFKTVFSITDNPHIDSGYYRFEFHRKKPTVPQIKPETTSTEETTITLPFVEDKLDEAHESIKQQLIDLSEYIKYLSQLELVQVKIVNSQGQRELINYHRKTKNAKQFVIKERDGECVETNVRKDFTKSVSVDGEEKEITLSIPVDSGGYHQSSESDPKLYCHFPTQDYIPVPFDLQADFQVQEDRRHILPDSEKNNRLLDAVTGCVREARDYFLHDRSEPTTFLSLLPDPKASAPSSLPDERTRISQRIKQGALSVFQESDCIECEYGDCSLHPPAEIFLLDDEFKHLFSATDYEELFDEQRYQLDSTYTSEISNRVRELSDVHDIEINELLNVCRDSDFIEGKSKEWVVEFCTAAAAYRDSKTEDTSEFDASLASLPLLWLSDTIIAPKQSDDEPVYFPLTKSWNPQGASDILSELSTLDRTFYKKLEEATNENNSDPKQLFKLVFDIKELKPKTLIKQVIPRLQSPIEDSEAKHNQAIRLLYEYYRRHGIPDLKQDFSELHLRTQTGEYKLADELFLADTYREELSYRLDPLAEALPSVSQVSEDYTELTSNKDSPRWGSFLRELGVRDRVPVRRETNGYMNRQSLREAIQEDENDRFSSFTMPVHLQTDHVENALPPNEAVRTKGYNGRDEYEWMKRRKQGWGHKYGLVDAKLDTGNLETLKESLREPNTHGVRKNLLKMIHANWDEYYSKFAYIKCAWAIEAGQYSAQDVETKLTSCPTTFIQMFRTEESIPCTDGSYRPPEEVYIDTTETKGAQVSLCALDLNEGFRDCLGIRTELGPEHLAYALRQSSENWKVGENDDLDQFLDKLTDIEAKLHSATEKKAEEVQEILTTIEYPVPDQPGEVRPFERLVWKGNNLNDWLLAVGDAYGTKFQWLMLSELDVPKSATVTQAINNYKRAIKADDKDQKQFGQVETAFEDLLKICANRGSNDFTTDLEEEIDTLPALDGTLTPVENISYYCSDTTAVVQAPDDVKQHILSVSPSNIDAVAVTEMKTVYNEVFGLKTLSSAWNKSVNELEPADDEPDIVKYYWQMVNLLYSILGEHSGYDGSPIEELHTLAGENPQWANQLTCTHKLDDTVVIENVEADCIVNLDSSSNSVVTLTTNVNSVALLATEFLTQLSVDDSTYSEVISVVEGAFGKPKELIEQYLEQRDYEFRSIPEETPNKPTNGETNSSGSDSAAEDDVSDSSIPEKNPSTDTDDSSVGMAGSSNTTDSIDQTQENDSPQKGLNEEKTKDNDADTTNQSEIQASEANSSTDNTKTQSEVGSSDNSSDGKPSGWSQNKDAAQNGTGSDDTDHTQESINIGSDNRQTDTDEIGKVAEAYTVWCLARAVESHFESCGNYIETEQRQTTAKEEEIAVRGRIQDDEYTIEIKNIGLERRGYDIRVSNTVLSDTSLSVSKIETGVVSTVEVKGSKSDSLTSFTMTKDEMKYGKTATDQYYVVRLQNVDPETKWPTASTAEVDRVWHGFTALKEDAMIKPSSYRIEY